MSRNCACSLFGDCTSPEIVHTVYSVTVLVWKLYPHFIRELYLSGTCTYSLFGGCVLSGNCTYSLFWNCACPEIVHIVYSDTCTCPKIVHIGHLGTVQCPEIMHFRKSILSNVRTEIASAEIARRVNVYQKCRWVVLLVKLRLLPPLASKCHSQSFSVSVSLCLSGSPSLSLPLSVSLVSLSLSVSL